MKMQDGSDERLEIKMLRGGEKSVALAGRNGSKKLTLPLKSEKQNILLVELRGHEELAKRMSADEAFTLQKTFHEVVESSVTPYNGFIVENIGYACLITFATATDVLRAGLKIQASLSRQSESWRWPFDVKLAISTNEVVQTERWNEALLRSVSLISKISDQETLPPPAKAATPPPAPAPKTVFKLAPAPEEKPAPERDKEKDRRPSPPPPAAKRPKQDSIERLYWRELVKYSIISVLSLTVTYFSLKDHPWQFGKSAEEAALTPSSLTETPAPRVRRPRLQAPRTEPLFPVDADSGATDDLASPLDEQPSVPEEASAPGEAPRQVAAPSANASEESAPALPSHGMMLDRCESPQGWRLGGDLHTRYELASVNGKSGQAIELRYDLGAGKWVQIAKNFRTRMNAEDVIRFFLKWEGANNVLEVKLEDGDLSTFGRRFLLSDFGTPGRWVEVQIPISELAYFWSGDSHLDLNYIKSVWFAVSVKEGGIGSVFIDELEVLQ